MNELHDLNIEAMRAEVAYRRDRMMGRRRYAAPPARGRWFRWHAPIAR